jgi:hypothetical protein
MAYQLSRFPTEFFNLNRRNNDVPIKQIASLTNIESSHFLYNFKRRGQNPIDDDILTVDWRQVCRTNRPMPISLSNEREVPLPRDKQHATRKVHKLRFPVATLARTIRTYFSRDRELDLGVACDTSCNSPWLRRLRGGRSRIWWDSRQNIRHLVLLRFVRIPSKRK